MLILPGRRSEGSTEGGDEGARLLYLYPQPYATRCTVNFRQVSIIPWSGRAGSIGGVDREKEQRLVWATGC